MSAPARASWCWPPPTARTCWTRRSRGRAASTAPSRSDDPTSPAAWRPSRQAGGSSGRAHGPCHGSVGVLTRGLSHPPGALARQARGARPEPRGAGGSHGRHERRADRGRGQQRRLPGQPRGAQPGGAGRPAGGRGAGQVRQQDVRRAQVRGGGGSRRRGGVSGLAPPRCAAGLTPAARRFVGAERRRRFAVMEAGISLAATLLPAMEPVDYVTITPSARSPLGRTVLQVGRSGVAGPGRAAHALCCERECAHACLLAAPAAQHRALHHGRVDGALPARAAAGSAGRQVRPEASRLLCDPHRQGRPKRSRFHTLRRAAEELLLGREELSSLQQHRLQMARQIAFKMINSGAPSGAGCASRLAGGLQQLVTRRLGCRWRRHVPPPRLPQHPRPGLAHIRRVVRARPLHAVHHHAGLQPEPQRGRGRGHGGGGPAERQLRAGASSRAALLGGCPGCV